MKRGESGLSLVVGVDKPCGMSSHDVVSRCRRIFGEKRVGHAGTLDPQASGVLIVCVGPATRLDKYLVGHDKTYLVDVAFGAATETDDREGAVIEQADVPAVVFDREFAASYVKTLSGKIMQVPPLYSALKKNGKKACDEARKGNAVELEPRAVEIYDVSFIELISPDGECSYPRWRLEVSVSKGTYIRSFARDLGKSLGTVAHVAELRRTRSGCLSVNDCVSLETLEQLSTKSALDPLPLLEYRFAYVDDAVHARLANGNALLASQINLMEEPCDAVQHQGDCCFPTYHGSTAAPTEGEYISVVYENKLAAIYRYSSSEEKWKADCVFNPSVMRKGRDL